VIQPRNEFKCNVKFSNIDPEFFFITFNPDPTPLSISTNLDNMRLCFIKKKIFFMVSDPQWFNADPDPGVFQISDHELLLRHNMFFLYKKICVADPEFTVYPGSECVRYWYRDIRYDVWTFKIDFTLNRQQFHFRNRPEPVEDTSHTSRSSAPVRLVRYKCGFISCGNLTLRKFNNFSF
jgi:hypothetical protein